MSRIHSVEVQLGGWQPRRPSAGLKRRLFGTSVHFRLKLPWAVGWLVSATACAMLTLSVFISENNFPGRLPRHEPMVVSVVNHQRFQGPAPARCQQRCNNLRSGVFDLTNRSVSTSSIATFSHDRVNFADYK